MRGETIITEQKFENFTWIDIRNPDPTKLESIAEKFNLNVLLVQDSLEPGHLPKIEVHKDYSFIILRAFSGEENENISTINELSNKIAFFYSKDRLITIHRAYFGYFEKFQQTYDTSAEQLVHLIGEMIESFEAPAKWQSDKIDEIEKIIFLEDNDSVSLEDLYFQKSQTRISKKLLQITRNVLNRLVVPEESRSMLRDVKDNLMNLTLLFDEVEEDANNLMNMHISVTAKKSNDVMKLLTIFSAFFLPLTFIVGIYGMNFHYMPELDWKYGYGSVLLVMFGLAVAIYYWFKRKNIM